MKDHPGDRRRHDQRRPRSELAGGHAVDAGKAGLVVDRELDLHDGFVERLRFEIDPTWQGDIPRTMLISRDGTITTIEGSAEMADLEKWSAQQLATN